ncbi:MAG TPA: glycosyltransferase [Patescibacteria group bacterium]|nr:glycosyltransferase [Patescibacteria group bacterium]
MKVALVHDHLTQDGGAERVLRVLSSMFPDAPIYCLAHNKDKFKASDEMEIRTSFLEKPPFSLVKFEWLLPFMPAATEHHDLREFDLVISSSSAMAKGVIPGTNAQHICYLHTPTRYLWTDMHDYVANLQVPGVVKKVLPHYLSYLRQWDKMAADRVNVFIANSKTVSERIQTFYQKDSVVIYPPVDTHEFSVSDAPKTYFLAGGRITNYKKFDLVVDAFNRVGLPIKIFGSGPFLQELKERAKGNIEFLGRVTDEHKAQLYKDCVAYLNPQEEDFGITAVEAMACGRPVIAYGKGGTTETVIEGKTGTLFNEQTWEGLADAVIRFKHEEFDPNEIRTFAESFSHDRFKKQMRFVIDKVYERGNRHKEPEQHNA